MDHILHTQCVTIIAFAVACHCCAERREFCAQSRCQCHKKGFAFLGFKITSGDYDVFNLKLLLRQAKPFSKPHRQGVEGSMTLPISRRSFRFLFVFVLKQIP